jgi:archaellum component FlaC
MLRKLLTENNTAEQMPMIEDLYLSIKAIQQKLEDEITCKQKTIEDSRTEIVKLRTSLQDKDALMEGLKNKVTEYQRNIEGNRQIINKLLNDLERMQQDIEWYKRTYENRSLLGVIKDKIKFVFANRK